MQRQIIPAQLTRAPYTDPSINQFRPPTTSSPKKVTMLRMKIKKLILWSLGYQVDATAMIAIAPTNAYIERSYGLLINSLAIVTRATPDS